MTSKRKTPAKSGKTGQNPVYTPVSPPLLPHINSAICRRILRSIPATRRPAHHEAYPFWNGYTDFWHAALAARDAAHLEAVHAHYQSRIRTHNHDVAGLASALDLTARDHTGTGIIQFDAAEMIRRIEAAAARHKNKAPRGHTSSNRHLAFHCPICSVPKTKPDGSIQWSNTVRASNPARIIICAGTAHAQHAPTPMEFDETSQPAYRLEDKYADPDLGTEHSGLGASKGHHQTQSQLQLAARQKPQAGTPTAFKASLDDTTEFGF